MRLRDARASLAIVERVIGGSEYHGKEFKEGAARAIMLVRQSVEDRAKWDSQRRAARRQVRREMLARREA